MNGINSSRACDVSVLGGQKGKSRCDRRDVGGEVRSLAAADGMENVSEGSQNARKPAGTRFPVKKNCLQHDLSFH
jgi:hypothetical protein